MAWIRKKQENVTVATQLEENPFLIKHKFEGLLKPVKNGRNNNNG